MAKITPYKFINPGVVATSTTPVVRATSKQLLAVNRLGSTVEGLGNIVADIVSNNKATIVFQKSLEVQKIKNERRALDLEAEAKMELANSRLDSQKEKQSEKYEDELDNSKTKKEKGGFLDFLEKTFGPLLNIFADIASIVITSKVLKYLADPANREKIESFVFKLQFVAEKIYKFAENIVGNILDGFNKLFGANSDFFKRIEGLGQLFIGIAALRYLMNPFKLIDDIFALIDGIGSFFDKKEKDLDTTKPTDVADVDDPEKVKPTNVDVDKPVQLELDFSEPEPAKKPNFLQRALAGASDWAKTQYENLSEAIRKQWDAIVSLGKKLNAKALAAASAVGNKVGDAAKFLKNGVSSLGASAKKYVLEKMVAPIKKAFAPLVDKLKAIGTKVESALFKTPLGKKAAEALKAKGLYPVMDNLGPLAKKLGGKALPIVGGALNLVFGYERLASGDPFGALLELLSAGFDISGLFGFLPGPGISMGLDAYLFARDLVPGIQEGEGKILNAIPGVKGIGDTIKKATAKLPSLGSIVSGLGGNKEKLEERAAGGSFGINTSKILANYEGLRTEAYADAIYGWGVPTIGIGATYYPPGFRLKGKVKKGDTITKDEAYAIKAKHVAEFTTKVKREVGSDVYGKLPDKVKAPLISKAFNYGSLGGTLSGKVKDAAKSDNYAGVAKYFQTVLANHDRRKNAWRRNDEAAIILTGRSPRTKVVFGGGTTSVDEDTSEESPTETSSRASGSESSSSAVEQEMPTDPLSAFQQVGKEIAKLFGSETSEAATPAAETMPLPNANEVVAKAYTDKSGTFAKIAGIDTSKLNTQFAKNYAIDKNGPELVPIPVAFGIAQPLITPMPINSPAKVVSTKPSPLLKK